MERKKCFDESSTALACYEFISWSDRVVVGAPLDISYGIPLGRSHKRRIQCIDHLGDDELDLGDISIGGRPLEGKGLSIVYLGNK